MQTTCRSAACDVGKMMTLQPVNGNSFLVHALHGEVEEQKREVSWLVIDALRVLCRLYFEHHVFLVYMRL